MDRNDIKGFALARQQGSIRPGFAGSRWRSSRIVTRLLRALGWSSPAVPHVVTREAIAAQGEPSLLHEQHFANEHEAERYARDMTARGYCAQVQQNVYDYSWSVEVYAAAPLADGPKD